MNRRQQKHDMMITFLAHAKETKKRKAKKSVFINTGAVRNYVARRVQKMNWSLREKLSSRYFAEIYMQLRGKYKLLSLLKNKRQ